MVTRSALNVSGAFVLLIPRERRIRHKPEFLESQREQAKSPTAAEAAADTLTPAERDFLQQIYNGNPPKPKS